MALDEITREIKGVEQKEFQKAKPYDTLPFRGQGGEEPVTDREDVLRRVGEKPEGQRHNKVHFSIWKE